MGSLSLLQGNFPTQGSNPGLLHCRQILYTREAPHWLGWRERGRREEGEDISAVLYKFQISKSRGTCSVMQPWLYVQVKASWCPQRNLGMGNQSYNSTLTTVSIMRNKCAALIQASFCVCVCVCVCVYVCVHTPIYVYIYVCMHAQSHSHVQLFVTPCTVAHQPPLSMGLSWQEYWSGLPFPSPGDLPDPGIEPTPPAVPALQVDSLPLSHVGRPCMHVCVHVYIQSASVVDHLLAWE